MKNLIFSLILSLFNCFRFILHIDIFLETLGLIWRQVRAEAQKPRLGGSLFISIVQKIWFKKKFLIFSLILSLFNCFHFILLTAIFFEKP